MASVWDVVKAANYTSVSENDENSAAQSPLPDKFKQKFTVNSLRMSLRKRMPLKRINLNEIPSQVHESEPKKNKVQSLKRKSSEVENFCSKNKNRSISMETSVKKTFYRVAEQFTGTAKKSQLKDTPRKLTPRTRYRERLRSPPATPGTPCNPFDSPMSPVCTTPLHQVEKLKKYTRSTTSNRKASRKSPRISAKRTVNRASDNFSRHLESVSCGIQHLEANSNKMIEAIDRIGLDYDQSPLCSKMRSQSRLWKDERNKYTSMGETCENVKDKAQPLANTKGMLRRTLTRMSFRTKNRPTLRSTKSTSDINPHCYVGPMTTKQRKLAPLHEYNIAPSK